MTDDSQMTPEHGPAESTPKKPFRWSRVVLVVSLALNLAVIGTVAGALLRWDAGVDRARAMQVRDFGFGPFVGALETKDRRDVGRMFIRSAGDPREARAEVKAMFAQMIATLKAEPFDRQAFETLLLQQQQKFSSRQEIGAQIVVDQIAQMSAPDRAAYATRLEDMLKKPPRSPHTGDGVRDAAPRDDQRQN